MNDAERFLLLGRQGEDISELAGGAGRASGAAGTEALHRLAIDRASIIPEAIRRELLGMVLDAREAAGALDAGEAGGALDPRDAGKAGEALDAREAGEVPGALAAA